MEYTYQKAIHHVINIIVFIFLNTCIYSQSLATDIYQKIQYEVICDYREALNSSKLDYYNRLIQSGKYNEEQISKLINVENSKISFLIKEKSNEELRDFIISGGNPRGYDLSHLNLDDYLTKKDYQKMLNELKMTSSKPEMSHHDFDKVNFDDKVEMITYNDLKIRRIEMLTVHMFSDPILSEYENYMIFSHKGINLDNSVSIDLYIYKKVSNDKWIFLKKTTFYL